MQNKKNAMEDLLMQVNEFYQEIEQNEISKKRRKLLSQTEPKLCFDMTNLFFWNLQGDFAYKKYPLRPRGFAQYFLDVKLTEL